MNRKRTTKEIIEKLKLTHGDKYDYSKVEYKGCTVPIEIICPKHGSFFTLTSNIVTKGGCRKCFQERNRLNKEEFLKRCYHLHGDLYEYDLTNYNTVLSKIRIKCKIHGWFIQTANDHLNKCVCPLCAQIKRAEKSKKLPSFFFERVKKIHKDFYIYDEKSFSGIKSKINIFCPKHGWFIQSANNHLKGAGCPRCSASKGELKIEAFLKSKDIPYLREFKINDCKDKNPLPFDFAIFEDEEKTKRKCLIEFDGQQHFRIAEYFKGTKETYLHIKCHDEIKNLYCSKNNVKLLRVPYWNFKDIDEILKQELF